MLPLLLACAAGKVSLDETAAADAPADTGGVDTGTQDTAADDTAIADTDTATDDDTATSEDTGEEPVADCLPYAFVADETLTLANGSSFDGYDASLGAYGGANASASLALNDDTACALTTGASVAGDVYVGGDPAATICETWGASTGTTHTLPSPVPLPTVTLPAGLPASSGDVTVAWGETRELAADLTVEDLTLAYGSALTVTASATLYVTGNLAMDGAPLTVAEGTTLDLYVDGGIRVGYGAALNTSGSPSQVRLRLTGHGTLQLDYGGGLSALVEQPGGAFTNGGGAFHGTWIGRSATTQWGAAVHLDVSTLCDG